MALDRNAELQHLNKADVYIADAEMRIAKQEVILEELRRNGHDTKEGERLLRMFKETLQAMRGHRADIVEAIAKIDAGLI